MQWLNVVSFMYDGRTPKFGGESHFWVIIGGIITIIVVLSAITLVWLKHKKKA